ncbi:MAG: hypothetical protein ACRDA0_09395 [Cetobacterium sp.]
MFNKTNRGVIKNEKELTYFENGSVKSEANYKNNGEISKTYIYMKWGNI